MNAISLRIRKAKSLKSRLIWILLLSGLIPLALLGWVSYLSIEEITSKKIESGLFNSLNQGSFNLSSTLNNMDYASLQLTNEGSVGQRMSEYLTTDSIYQKLELGQSIQQNLNLVNFTNPNLGVTFYYLPKTREVKFENLAIEPGFNFNELPKLTERNGVQFYGPHASLYRYGTKNQVFSLVRPLNLSGADPVYLYIETNDKLFGQIMDKQQYGMNAYNVLINEQGGIVYSDLPKTFQLGNYANYAGTAAADTFKEKRGDYYLFGQHDEQGWTLMVVIPRKDFEKEFNKWILKYILIVSGSLFISLIFAYVLWRTVYRPLRKVGNEIQLLSMSKFDTPESYTDIVEFDFLMQKYYQMRTRIQELIGEVEQREHNKRQLEVEKLLYQLNPHFIHNTLNTIQWLARKKGHTEIDQFVSVFTRILHYNLGKKGEIVALRDELSSMQDYVALQRVRYDCEFRIETDIENQLLDIDVPRFILQPIVENALYHGLSEEDGQITLRIYTRMPESKLVIEVQDNGNGMTPEEIAKVMLEEKNPLQKSGLGIGLDYVKRVLGSLYGNDCSFSIDSQLGQGTIVKLMIPLAVMDSEK
ncbi:two-component system sensor histidine kinase YesM [Paenibacillus taihuensis]|uniref:histidine kinase n=1 Tax=Paenibacillus taihuensis TaxID=1156355 RepID=A0A3D9SFC6_9BACL|nr:histidine kinase [Paenibacillus taihuensis]REE87457.1 two-component system sensor histidine kinase YesM [Paenibacillus taihuensis]